MNTKEEKYLKYLIEVKSVLELTNNVSMSKIAKKNGISKTAATVLLENGILRKEGSRGLGVKWYWNSPVSPNIEMARRTIAECKKYSIRMNELAEAKRKEEVFKNDLQKAREATEKIISATNKEVERPQETPKTIEWSILWGLFKYKKA